MEKTESKISCSKFIKEKCKYYKCRSYIKPKCESKEKTFKLKDSIVLKVGDKAKSEV